MSNPTNAPRDPDRADSYRQQLAALRERRRTAARSMHRAGRSIRQIADALDVAPDTVWRDIQGDNAALVDALVDGGQSGSLTDIQAGRNTGPTPRHFGGLLEALTGEDPA